MTFGQIKCFMTVVNEQSFAKAASILFISQPAVSKSVAKLEAELGLTLIDRHGGELSLTPAGRRLYNFYIRVETDYQDLIENIRQFASASRQTLRIGCPDTWNPERFYSRIMDRFRTGDPPVVLEIEGFQMFDLFNRLQTDKLDFIMTYESQRPLQYGFSVLRLAHTSSRLLYSKAHYGEVQSLSDLRGVDILTFDTQQIEKRFARAIKRVFSVYGFEPEIRTCSSFISAMFSMSSGNGAVLLTDWENAEATSRFGMIALPNLVPINLVYMDSADKPYRKVIANEIAALFAADRAASDVGMDASTPFFT